MYSVNKGPVYLLRKVEGMITRCFQPQSLPAPTLPPARPLPPPLQSAFTRMDSEFWRFKKQNEISQSPGEQLARSDLQNK